MNKHKRLILAFAGVVMAVAFAMWLMFHTFSYDTRVHTMHIASKAWSDFAAHIPLIRSFSYGDNFSRLLVGQPPESPLFPGEPIRYHFGFYAFVGFLERLGVPIDWALNVPSALGFSLLVVLVFLIAAKLFSDWRVGALSALFFLFNGSLSFVEFFRQHPLSLSSLSEIINNTQFPSFGPWDGGSITAFWTLNIYTNQRHLALSYALVLLIMSLGVFTYKKLGAVAKVTSLAFLFGLLLFFNQAAAGIAILFLAWMLVSQPSLRKTLLVTGALLIPLTWLSVYFIHTAPGVVFQPGYLAHTPWTPASLLKFWFDNIGLHILLIPLGVAIAPARARGLLAIPMIVLFVAPNLFRFSPDMINNHKFFNFALILGNMFSAYVVVRVAIVISRTRGHRYVKRCGQVVVLVGLVGLLTFSGIIDLFPIINDSTYPIADAPVNYDVEFFLTQTAPDVTILNSTWLYHPASLAGRSIFWGYPYFTWSYGYDTDTREVLVRSIYQATDIIEVCDSTAKHNISFVEVDYNPEAALQPVSSLWTFLPTIYENSQTGMRVWRVADICPNPLSDNGQRDR